MTPQERRGPLQAEEGVGVAATTAGGAISVRVRAPKVLSEVRCSSSCCLERAGASCRKKGGSSYGGF